MGNTVFAEGMGFFHKGSGGKGVAPGDVCLTPPPPPAGPLPVPYVNMLQASDLAQGSKSVKIQGEPTALESSSYVSTSTGNEAGTQGGGVVTHKTKGKGSFTLWSFLVKVEGKGVCRHGDPMLQNTASPLPNCVDTTALVNFENLVGGMKGVPCDEEWDDSKHYSHPTRKQDEACVGGPCWECSKAAKDTDYADPGVWDTAFKIKGRKRVLSNGHTVMVQHKKKRRHRATTYDEEGNVAKEGFTADHQPPQELAWKLGGCHLKPSPDTFKAYMQNPKNVKPHCRKHYKQQGGTMLRWSQNHYEDWAAARYG